MSQLGRLEHRWSWLAVQGIPLGVALGQGLMWVLVRLHPEFEANIPLVGALVLQGQIWRLLTFVFDPPNASALFAFIGLYAFYFIGSTLEQTWGVVRFNIFLLTGYLLTVAVALLNPMLIVTNAYLGLSVFLAFALLYPDYSLLLFFVLPVKMRWLGLLAAVLLIWAFIGSPWPERMVILASVSNLLLFFGGRLLGSVQQAGRRTAWEAKVREVGPVTHMCTVCGRTEVSNPELNFVYCNHCAGTPCYCEEHARNHVHRT